MHFGLPDLLHYQALKTKPLIALGSLADRMVISASVVPQCRLRTLTTGWITEIKAKTFCELEWLGGSALVAAVAFAT